MSKHEAVEQMLGYVFQMRYALYLLLINDDDDAMITIEKVDDVSFNTDNSVYKMVQLKHHVGKSGKLTDYSVDLWKTIKVWLDKIDGNCAIYENTKFIIASTAEAPEGSAAYYLRDDRQFDKRDASKAYVQLLSAAQKSTNESIKKSFEAFLHNESISKWLVNNIYVIDKTSDIIDVKEDIKRVIRYASRPKFEKLIFERLEGWWNDRAIDFLMSEC